MSDKDNNKKKRKTYEYENPILKNNINGTAGQPKKFQSAKQMQDKIDNYFEKCTTNKFVKIDKQGNTIEMMKPPLWIDLIYNGLESFPNTLTPYRNGDYDDEDNNYSQILERAQAQCLAYQLEGGMVGVYNDRIIRLTAAHFHNVIEKQEINSTSTVTHQLKQHVDADERIKQLNNELALLRSGESDDE